MALLSTLPLSAWRSDVTIFRGFTGTAPADELADAPWGVVAHYVASLDGPVLQPDKRKAPYFVPCLLAVAPLVAGTLALAIKHGRQRWPRKLVLVDK
jgi:hypothetical protein